MKVAIVGSGPAGFYAAGHLFTKGQDVQVDMIDRLPTPWGLVRLGVAPDHPNIKAVSRVFEKIARNPGFRFLGNVEIGRDLTPEELDARYDATIYAVGAQSDRALGIPGESLDGSWSATAFVAWYNGHPDFRDLPFNLSCERVVVIGNGNVAIDVARMLALTESELRSTDTADEAIEAIAQAGVKEIVVVGRRGPAQAAFTTPELQELGELEGADVLVDRGDLILDSASEAALANDTAGARRNVEVLREYAGRAPGGKPRSLHLRFLLSPSAILGSERVEAIELVRNVLETGADGSIRAVATDECETVQCGLVLRSVGYRSSPIAGVPFDESRGTISNVGGRIVGADGEVVPGLYCAGWVKRGPTGVIGTNKKDATETVELLLEDAAAGRLPTPDESLEDAVELLEARGVHVVMYAGWEEIDRVERTAGETHGRPRVKLCTWDELLETSRSASAQGPA